MKQVLIFFFLLVLLSCKTKKPVVINLPERFENPALIQDCPEELIIDGMPMAGKLVQPNQYYIYKGESRQIKEFDSVWVNTFCRNIKVTHVQ